MYSKPVGRHRRLRKNLYCLIVTNLESNETAVKCNSCLKCLRFAIIDSPEIEDAIVPILQRAIRMQMVEYYATQSRGSDQQ